MYLKPLLFLGIHSQIVKMEPLFFLIKNPHKTIFMLYYRPFAILVSCRHVGTIVLFALFR